MPDANEPAEERNGVGGFRSPYSHGIERRLEGATEADDRCGFVGGESEKKKRINHD
jgi:hypothetical protein